MIVVLAHAHDRGATAVAAAVAAWNRLPVLVVRPEWLGLSDWSQQVQCNGRVATRITLPGGGRLDCAHIDCLLNRLEYLSTPRFARASAKDKDYAAVEMQALICSWLGSLGDRVINPIGRSGGIARADTPRRWVREAAACGLPVMRSLTTTAGRLLRPLQEGERASLALPCPVGHAGSVPVEVVVDESRVEPAGIVLIAGHSATGPLADRFGPRCGALAARLDYRLAEFGFSRIGGRVVLTTVNPCPALATDTEVDAVSRLLARAATVGVDA